MLIRRQFCGQSIKPRAGPEVCLCMQPLVEEHWSCILGEEVLEVPHACAQALVRPVGWRWLWEKEVWPVCSRSSPCSLAPDCTFKHATPMWIAWRQGSVPIHRGKTMLLAVICASKPWATPSLPVSKHCCWYPPQELTCRFSRQLQRVGSDHPRPSELSACKFHYKLFGALTVGPTLSNWLGHPHSVARGLQAGERIR